MKPPKILAVASAIDLDFKYGCTPAWWQLWKGLHEAGVDLIVTPYRGRPVEAPWWRTEPNPCYREGELFAGGRDLVARIKGDTHIRRAEESPPDTTSDRLVRDVIWRWVTPRWQRHLERILEREGDVDAVVVFTVPMSHLRGVATKLRERFSVPVVFYDGDVPMSLPEFGGMDTGFNYYHGADPSEYDLVVSNSEGGLERLRELGARRAEAIFWGADPELFRPLPVEKTTDVFFYGYGEKFRAEWIDALVIEPSRRLPQVDFTLGGNDFRARHGCRALHGRRAVQRASRTRSRRHASTSTSHGDRTRPCPPLRRRGRSSWRCPARPSSRTRTRASSAGSSPVASCWSSVALTRRWRRTRSCSGIPAAWRRWVAPPASARWRSTRTSTARGSCWICSTSRCRRHLPRAGMGPEPTSESGEYWKEHVLSWEAGAYYKDRSARPAFWDRVSSIFRGRAMYVRMDTALQLVSPHVSGMRVLDIGCGSGRFAFELLAAGVEHVTGIDVSSAASRRPTRSVARARAETGSTSESWT